MNAFQSALTLLGSHAKLERDKGCLSLKVAIQNVQKNDNSSEVMHNFEDNVISYLTADTEHQNWEETFGYLQAAKVFVESRACSDTFPDRLLLCGLKFLEHEEFRVRIVAGEVLGALCKEIDSGIYKQCEDILLTSIRNNLTREIPADGSSTHAKDAKEIFHDTAGWKCLETSMKGLQSIIDGCGEKFVNYVSMEVLNLIFDTLLHTNRFVRETGYYLCAALARYGVSSKDESSADIAHKLAEHLRIGLADNWSQVRLAASVATRHFFQDMNNEDKKTHFKVLLPPMCLNRYYLAEGVKIYNQATWSLIMGTEGPTNVALYINEVVDFYIKQTESDNHAVREAACHCMAELSSKINHAVVKPFVPQLLDGLHFCFQDESWPVRDTACIACGKFILNFSSESKQLIDKLYPLFFANLFDPIPSVRQGAAISLTNVAKAYGDEALDVIFNEIEVKFNGVKSQKAISERYEGLDKGVATYGVVKQLHDNDLELHSNQQMYSCGSLAPKMGRSGGCMDHSFKRASEPWEITDGCIYLVAEMASFDKALTLVQKCLPVMAEITQYKHYTHHLHLFESINKVIPPIARGLGKKIFKQYIESFFDAIFYSLACENTLTKVAATECIEFLNKFLGPSILRGRVEQYNPSLTKYLDEVAVGKRKYIQ